MMTQKNTQTGRSMIEMLGVLAIIGVLSVGGIAGYSKAMMKFKVNKSVDEITQISTNIRTLFGGQRNYADLTLNVIQKTNLVPAEMGAGSAATGDGASGFNFSNPWGEKFNIKTANRNDGEGATKAFVLTSANIPTEACVELAILDWGTSGSGLIAMGVGADVTSTYANTCTSGTSGNGYILCGVNGETMSPKDAVDACEGTNGLQTIYWKFY